MKHAWIFAALLGFAAVASAQQDRAAMLDRAYEEMLLARQGLDEAEARRERGVEPLPGERLGIAGGGSRLDEAYFERQKRLQQEVDEARERYREAIGRWNALR